MAENTRLKSTMALKLVVMLVFVVIVKSIMFATPYYDSVDLMVFESVWQSIISGANEGWAVAPVMFLPLLMIWLAEFISMRRQEVVNGFYLAAYFVVGTVLVSGAVIGHFVIDPLGAFQVFIWMVTAEFVLASLLILFAAIFSRDG